MALNWNDRPFGSNASGANGRRYQITPDGRRFYLEVNGVQQCEGSLAACKNKSQTIEDSTGAKR